MIFLRISYVSDSRKAAKAMAPPPTTQAQLVRGATEVAPPTPITWSKHFPKQVESFEQSLKFTQKLLALGVSNVVFLRNVFPEEAFASGKALGKIPIRILKGKNPIKVLNGWKKYLDT